MRTLLILRGAPGCGKSTWIKEHGLEPYTLCADTLRLMYNSPMMQIDGTMGIDQGVSDIAWETLFSMLEFRMKKGAFTVIDATNSKTSELTRYKQLCQDYRYRIYLVDFTTLPIEEVKRRNVFREELKRVPDYAIDRMYERFKTEKVPSGIKVIAPDELDTIWMKPIDLSHYKKIHHIGDVHGCHTVLQEYLAANGGIKDDEYYIFTGDYIDRGIENAAVLEFLFTIMDRKNVLLLEGNHERWLNLFAHDKEAKSKEFENNTKPQLLEAGVSKKTLRQFYRKLAQCAYYHYGNKYFLVTHAGLGTLPDNLTLISTDQMIHGVGRYSDYDKVAKTFLETAPCIVTQIHGHRNITGVPVQANERMYNLENEVEFGGNLRCVQVDSDGIHTFETKNTVFKKVEPKQEKIVTDKVPETIEELVTMLRNNPYVQEKQFGNISSFNFTSKAFYGKVWNEQTCKARGLFIDTFRNKVCMRSFEKFFNVNERPETLFSSLEKNLQYPLIGYVKENGFLGMVSYDEYGDNLLIASKSTVEGDYAGWVREMLHKTVAADTLEAMKSFIKENDVTFVFECVDMEHDPHIIEYPESKLILLDIVSNEMEFKKYEYNDMVAVAHRFGLTPKEKAIEINSWTEFRKWYKEVMHPDYELNGRKIEGFVLEDATGFMVKVKLHYYNFWKQMRKVSEQVFKNGCIGKSVSLDIPLAQEFYAWMKDRNETSGQLELDDICTLRRAFYASREN